MSSEKQVSYQSINTYEVLNTFTPKTRNVWVVCHGIGYLSRYFLKYFRHLNSEENYFIAPQAPSKYYLNGKYTHVGASWLTRENTELEIENLMNYLDEIYKAEHLENAPNLLLFGYSQGVSVVTRWVARRKIACNQLIMHSGRVPAELKAKEFSFLKDAKFHFIYGEQDEFLNQEIIKKEENHLKAVFPRNLEIRVFQGGHEVNRKILTEFV
ncbi:alpha/beta hydrolase [Salegentibacter sp. F14]